MFDLNNLDGLMGNMKEKMAEFEEAKNEQEEKVFTIKSGGGLIDVQIKGSGEIIDLNIDDTLLSDKESLQILLMGCLNECYSKVDKDKSQHAMSSMMNGIGDLMNAKK